MSEQKQYKSLPVGVDKFYKLVKQDKYFVDKTAFIKTIIEDDGEVVLFTRPRRFGKTLFMTMLGDFLRINEVNPDDKSETKELFKNTQILKDKEFTDKYLGNYPVISISLKDVVADDFEKAYALLADTVLSLIDDLTYLKHSDKVSKINKQKLEILSDIKFIKDPKNSSYLVTALKDISTSLYQHFNKQVVILIDEYDVPLAKAALYGYHDKMVTTMSSFLGVLKASPINKGTQEQIVYKVIMTGCLKVTINDFLSGPNNLSVNTVLDNEENFTSMFGFNKSEVLKMLDYYDMSDYEDLVKDNYGGYKFNDDELFCPWDVMNFLALNHRLVLNNEKDKVEAANYLNGSSSASSTVIKDYLAFLSKYDNQNLQDLVDGKTIDVSINDFKNHDSLSMNKAEDFYTLLLHTGYLTSVGNPHDNIYTIKIPNREIHDCFKTNIMAYFNESLKSNGENKALKLADALLNGNTDTASDIIFESLQNYVSVRDFATKANNENFYHGFLSCVFSNCSEYIFNYKSNVESGDGYADIRFMNLKLNKVVIIEIKVATQALQLMAKAKEAIAQIKEKNYAKEYADNSMITDIQCYGLAFFAHKCFLFKE